MYVYLFLRNEGSERLAVAEGVSDFALHNVKVWPTSPKKNELNMKFEKFTCNT